MKSGIILALAALSGLLMADVKEVLPKACVEQVIQAKKPVDLLPSRFVRVTEDAKAVTLSFDRQTVTWDKSSLRVSVKGAHGSWSFAVPSQAVVRQAGKDYKVALSSAGKREFVREEFGGTCGMKVKLSGFTSKGTALDVKAVLYVAVEWMTGDVKLEFRPVEGAGAWRQVHWPGSFVCEDTDAAIVPLMQGLKVPRNWPAAFYAPASDGPGYGMCYGRSLYMPWWGYVRGENGCMIIIEDPVDCGYCIDHQPGRGTRMEPWLIHSMGRMTYTRRMRVKTFKGDHVAMAKAYRAYLKERGQFVGLEAKILRTPTVARLIGSPIIHTFVDYTDMRDPKFPQGKSIRISYDQHIKHMKRMKSLGFKELYWHFDGVGFRGYDNLEPDQLPVGTPAGGADGLKRMMKTAHDLGFLTVYHQQFRDFYLDSPSYNQELAKMSEDGSIQIDNYWAGGKNAIICPIFSADYVRRNNTALDILDGDVDGCYLDVFSVVPGDECYNPEHRIDRTQCYALRRECFEYIKDKWGITSSEEPTAWAVPYLDLVHHAPWPVWQKKGFGIPLPLHNLVFHDSILVPYETDGRRGGASNYPAEDVPYLFGLMNAQMPYLNEEADLDAVERVKFAVKVQARLGRQEMTNHELLSADGRIQRATYADGTTITMDQKAATAEIRYPEGKGVKVILDDKTGKATFKELD